MTDKMDRTQWIALKQQMEKTNSIQQEEIVRTIHRHGVKYGYTRNGIMFVHKDINDAALKDIQAYLKFCEDQAKSNDI
jgi:hypothetical protein